MATFLYHMGISLVLVGSIFAGYHCPPLLTSHYSGESHSHWEFQCLLLSPMSTYAYGSELTSLATAPSGSCSASMPRGSVSSAAKDLRLCFFFGLGILRRGIDCPIVNITVYINLLETGQTRKFQKCHIFDPSFTSYSAPLMKSVS